MFQVKIFPKIRCSISPRNVHNKDYYPIATQIKQYGHKRSARRFIRRLVDAYLTRISYGYEIWTAKNCMIELRDTAYDPKTG